MLHLGDFIYEVVEYPEETPHRYSRTVYDLGHSDARKVGNLCADQSRRLPPRLPRISTIPISRTPGPIFRSCMGDNHEFSWQGWQSSSVMAPRSSPRSRCASRPTRRGGNISSRPQGIGRRATVQFAGRRKVAIDTFDDDGFGTETNNRIAVGMTAYRALCMARRRSDPDRPAQLQGGGSHRSARGGGARLRRSSR